MIQHKHRFAWILVLTLAVAKAQAGFFSRLANLRADEIDQDGFAAFSGLAVEQGVAFAANLRNNSKIPLVGFGTTNLHPEIIPAMVSEAIQDDKRTRLIDASPGHEGLVARGILEGVGRMRLLEKLQVHVVSKIPYAYLGFERTKFAVEEVLRVYESVLTSEKVDLKIHFVVQWPKCYDTVMNCGREEAMLPQHIRSLGGDPLRNPDGAWKESWRVLEDFYLSEKYPIVGVGVGNFHLHHLEELESFARVSPSLMQVTLWSLIYDHQLMDYCEKHGIHVQVYNIMEGTLHHPEKAPHAYHHMQTIAMELSSKAETTFTPPQVLFAWIIQHGVSIVVGTSNMALLGEDSALSVTSVPVLDDSKVETLAHAVEAYLSGTDMVFDTPVKVTFHASTKDMMVYYLTEVDEVKVGLVRKGQFFNETTFPGHVYRLYDAKNKDVFVDHVVKPHVGLQETVHVDIQALGTTADRQAVSMNPNETGGKPNVLNWLGGVLQGRK